MPGKCQSFHVYHAEDIRQIAPRPRSVADTGLSTAFLADLIAKHLYWGGVLDQQQLMERTTLAWPIVENLLAFLRTAACVEVRGGQEGSPLLRYALTERGRNQALDALQKSGYVGPAPIPADLYSRVVRAQSVHGATITRQTMSAAFDGVVVRESVLDQLGPAMHSGRPIFIYGPPGTGKSYIGQKLSVLLGGPVLIPYAVAVGDYVIQFFDPALHHAVDGAAQSGLMLEEGHDPRFVLCRRPAVITGGELTLDMLELSYDPAVKQYFAPLQLKANNGIYMVDDLGRQRVATDDLLNRWIVPLEQKLDYLNVGSGTRFAVPFNVVLIFSTNLNPLELADEAFLRRLGYKVRFDTLTPPEYEAIWRQTCAQRAIIYDESALYYVFERYREEQRPLLPCQPRDLLGLAMDLCRYQGGEFRVTAEHLDHAWSSYFVRPV